MSTNIISAIRQELVLNIDEKTLNGYRNYFKEPVIVHGVKTAVVNRIAKDRFKEVKDLGKQAVFALCEELFASDYSEEAFIACNWAYRMHDKYEPSDFEIFER